MEYLRKPLTAAWDVLARPFRPRGAPDAPRRPLAALDVYAEHLADVVLWRDKGLTLRYFVLVNQFVWLALLLNLRPFGTLALVLLAGFLADRFYRDRLFASYTGRHKQLIETVQRTAAELWHSLWGLRKNSRALFAMVMSLVFMWLHLASRMITGTWLVIALTMLVFVVPIALKSLNKNVLVKLPLADLPIERRVLAEEELIPFIADKDLDNKDPDLDSLLTDKTADSVSTSLTAGLGAMPSYLEVAGAADEIREEDLMPRGPSRPPSVPSSDSDDGGASAAGVHFDSDHFAGSSSEEEAQLARGLLASPPPPPPPPPPRKDSDSDFEIVNSDDLDD